MIFLLPNCFPKQNVCRRLPANCYLTIPPQGRPSPALCWSRWPCAPGGLPGLPWDGPPRPGSPGGHPAPLCRLHRPGGHGHLLPTAGDRARYTQRPHRDSSTQGGRLLPAGRQREGGPVAGGPGGLPPRQDRVGGHRCSLRRQARHCLHAQVFTCLYLVL